MSIRKAATGILTSLLLVTLVGCGDSHARKKEALIEHWEASTAKSQLPAVESMIEQGQLTKAKRVLGECVESDPKEPGVFVLIGRIHAIEGHNDQARTAFEEAVTLDAKSDQGWHFLGSLAVLEKDYERALEAYQKSVELVPTNTDYVIALSDVYAEIGQFGKSLEIINQGLEIQPQNVDLLLSKARICQQAGQADETIRCYEQARIMHGDIPKILEPAGYAYIAQKKWNKAAEMFDLLIKEYTEEDPRYNPTMRSLARCLFNDEQYASALLWYDKLSIIYREDMDIWLDMAQAALGLNDPTRAAYCANQAIKIKPSNSQAHALLGSAHYMGGLYDQSIKAFYKITGDDELGGFAWFMSGRCYQQLGESRQANLAFERAEELDPDNQMIVSFLRKTVHPL